MLMAAANNAKAKQRVTPMDTQPDVQLPAYNSADDQDQRSSPPKEQKT